VYEELTAMLISKVLPEYGMPAEVAKWTKEVRPRSRGVLIDCLCGRFRDARSTVAVCVCASRTAQRLTPGPIDATPQMIEYNVPGGKLNRGITVVHA
jgi:hypothetical protein